MMYDFVIQKKRGVSMAKTKVSQANKDLRKIPVSVRIPELLFNKLRSYMKKEELNFTETIITLLKKGLNK